MTPREMQGAFEYAIHKYDQVGIVKSDVIFHWLNTALIQFVETKYSNKIESFEETQTVTDELKNLVSEVSINTTNYTFRSNGYVASLPSNYLHALNEEVTIQFNNSEGTLVIKRVGVVDSSSATVTSQLTDPYSPHILHYGSAKPIRLFNDTGVVLLSDGNYTVPVYHLRYLRYPSKITLANHSTEYIDIPSQNHIEIVEVAALLFLKSLGIPPSQPNKNENNKNN